MEVDISSVFHQMLILFLILAIGYAAGKTGIMSLESNKALSKLVNCIACPCTVLYSALCTEHVLQNREVLILLAIAFGLFGFMILYSQAIPWLLKVPKAQSGQYKFMVTFSNMGYMGIPVISAIYGDAAVFQVSIFIMVNYIVLYTYGLYLIRSGEGEFRFRDMLTPMMIASVAALVLYLCGARVPKLVEDTMDSVRKITTPCAMLVIGTALSAVPLRSVFGNWRLYVIAAFKLVLAPLAVFLILRNLIANEIILGIIITCIAMPVATNFTMLSAQYDRDQKLAATSVFITTLLSVITIPLLTQLLFA